MTPTATISRPSLTTDLASDNEIMFRVRDGEVAKLGLLFERYNEKLFGFFVRHTNKARASEDLVQDVFLRILKYRHTFRGDAPFTVWMYRLARNASADYFRKWKNETVTEEDFDERTDDAQTPAEMTEEREQHALLRQALSRISAEKREVLVMSRYQEMKYDEIALVLNCPVGTVKARIHFAMKDLRDEYRKLTQELT